MSSSSGKNVEIICPAGICYNANMPLPQQMLSLMATLNLNPILRFNYKKKNQLFQQETPKYRIISIFFLLMEFFFHLNSSILSFFCIFLLKRKIWAYQQKYKQVYTLFEGFIQNIMSITIIELYIQIQIFPDNFLQKLHIFSTKKLKKQNVLLKNNYQTIRICYIFCNYYWGEVMCLVKSFRQLLVKFDFFPATQFFRYKGSTEYRTATGGIFTILIIIIFCILFFNALLDIIAKKNVTLKSEIQHQQVPVPAQVNFGPSGGFLFALRINGMNLSQTDVKYFDISLQQNQYTPVLQLVNSRSIPLQMCTPSHFNFTQQILSAYYQFNASSLLCPSLNSTVQVKGKVSSSSFKRMTVSIKKCNTTLNSNCASDIDVSSLQNSLGYFGFAVVLINTQLNPTLSTNYKQYYLEDRNFFPFTTTLAVRGNAELEQYKITTDQSIIPLSDKKIETGLRIPDLFQCNVIPVLANTYAVIHFEKSSTYQTYTRSYGKLDTLLAYVGGLIGTILGLIFILDSYNELCYQLSLSSRLFTYQQGEQIKADEFNFFFYMVYLLNKIFNRVICCKGLRKMRIITECQEEIEKQLDVALLLKKVIFFERAITKLSDRAGIELKTCYQKNTLDQLKICRLNFEIEDNEESDNSNLNTVELNQKQKAKVINNTSNQGKPIVLPLYLEPHIGDVMMGIQQHQKLNTRLNAQLLDRQSRNQMNFGNGTYNNQIVPSFANNEKWQGPL